MVLSVFPLESVWKQYLHRNHYWEDAMTKRHVLLPAFLIALAGCGNSTAAAPTATTASVSSIPSPESTASAETDATSFVDEAAAYQPLIERFNTIVTDPDSYQEEASDGESGALEAASILGGDAPYYMGYLIEDLSGDGIAELAIGQLSGPINALYTLKETEPQLVFEGTYRSSYEYSGSGTFIYKASASAFESGVGTYVITKDGTGLVCQSFMFTSPNADGDLEVYSSETGSWDTNESTKSDMTAEEFWDLNTFVESLPLTPFDVRSSEESEYPVHIQYLPQLNSADYEGVTLGDGPDASMLLVRTDSPVREFTFWNLMVEDVLDSGDIIFSASPITLSEEEALPEVLMPQTPIAVQVVFPGDLSAYGISYVDEDGNRRCFTIEVSGMDGSLLLREAELGDGQFIVHPAG